MRLCVRRSIRPIPSLSDLLLCPVELAVEVGKLQATVAYHAFRLAGSGLQLAKGGCRFIAGNDENAWRPFPVRQFRYLAGRVVEVRPRLPTDDPV
jgi:hypothetical protein